MKLYLHYQLFDFYIFQMDFSKCNMLNSSVLKMFSSLFVFFFVQITQYNI